MTKKVRLSKEERTKGLRKKTEQNIKNKENGSGGNFIMAMDYSQEENVVFFKPKKGKYRLDILPYLVASKKHPQKLKIGMEDYALELAVHQRVGPGEGAYVCPKKNYGKPCPICEEIEAMKSAGKDKAEYKPLYPKSRIFYNVIDLDDEDKGIQLFEVSRYLFEKELLEAAEDGEDGPVTFADLEDGATVHFKAVDANIGKINYVEFKNFTFAERDSYEEDILEETISLDSCIVQSSYETIRDAFLGIDTGEEEDDDDNTEEGVEETVEEEVEEKAPRKKRSKTNSFST